MEQTMSVRAGLVFLFGAIFLSLLGYVSWASTQQSVWAWQGMTVGSDRWWTIAAMLDAYYGFITFYVWVVFKERSMPSRLLWFVLIMTTGNIASAAYILIQLLKLRPDEPVSTILVRRAAH
jgi:hypothetical protein